MGPKNNFVDFKSLLCCLLVKTWSSSQHWLQVTDVMVIWSLPSYLVMHFRFQLSFSTGKESWSNETDVRGGPSFILRVHFAYGLLVRLCSANGRKDCWTLMHFCPLQPWLHDHRTVSLWTWTCRSTELGEQGGRTRCTHPPPTLPLLHPGI